MAGNRLCCLRVRALLPRLEPLDQPVLSQVDCSYVPFSCVLDFVFVAILDASIL